MSITEERIRDIEGRLTALEQAQNDNTQSLRWLIKTLADVKAGQDQHTHWLERIETRLDHVEARLGGVETRLDTVETRLGRIETDVSGLRRELPGIVASAVREALRR